MTIVESGWILWVWLVGVVSGGGWNLWVWLAGDCGWNLWVWLAGDCGWNLWVWLVGVVVRRYIGFLIYIY